GAPAVTPRARSRDRETASLPTAPARRRSDPPADGARARAADCSCARGIRPSADRGWRVPATRGSSTAVPRVAGFRASRARAVLLCLPCRFEHNKCRVWTPAATGALLANAARRASRFQQGAHAHSTVAVVRPAPNGYNRLLTI